jgi:hypothetical protein
MDPSGDARLDEALWAPPPELLDGHVPIQYLVVGPQHPRRRPPRPITSASW